MPSLKDLKNRIDSVKNTRKITSAMKMVAAAKLRRAQDQAVAARPYAAAMARMMANLATSAKSSGEALPALINGTGQDDTVLLLVVTSDRGLAGMFNGSVAREARRQTLALQAQGKQVKIFTVGRKGRDLLKRDFPKLLVGSIEDYARKKINYSDAAAVQAQLLQMFDAGQFDRAIMVYNQFKSAISQPTMVEQLVPVSLPESAESTADVQAVYEFEPDAATILAELLPKSMGLAIYKVMMESVAGEHAARMTAMDNATRNAGDMITRLTLVYNRSRQAAITKELIEIISGAEAV